MRLCRTRFCLMRPAIHILVTIRKPELRDAALLVFRTLRVGFPGSPVLVWGNGLTPAQQQDVATVSRDLARAHFITNLPLTSHDAWIEQLINTQTDGFWICDTDMVFFEPVTLPVAVKGFVGRYEPEFDEEWTGTRHVDRLHTCLMFINPTALRQGIRHWQARIPSPWRDSAQFPLVRQHFIPVRAALNAQPETLFYDTMAGLWHAGLGTPFTPEQDAAFEHLCCGTYADLVDAPSLANLRAVHQSVYSNPERARGLKQAQDTYYQERKYAKSL